MATDDALRILFVEDVNRGADLAHLALRREQLLFEGLCVSTESDYIAALRDFAPDLIISGFVLSGFDGMRVLRIAQSLDPNLPVIIFTGSTSQETAVELMKAGAWDYVLKSGAHRLPFSVRSVMERRDARRDGAVAEAALHESEGKYRLLLEHSGVGLVYIAVDGKILWLNRRAAQYVSSDTETVIGQTIADVGDKLNSAEFRRRLDLAAATSEAQQYEDYFPRLSPPCWLHSTFASVFNARGEPQGVQVIFQDITARKSAEEQLRTSENLLQRAFDLLPVGLWFADEHGQMLRGNPAGIRIWGADPVADPQGHSVYRARRLNSGEEIAPDDWASVRTVNEGVTITDELLEIDAFDGEKRIILNHSAPVLGDDGRIRGAVIVNQDITAMKRAEQEREALLQRIGEQAEQLAHVMRSVPEGVLLLDPENRVVLANPRAQGDLRALAGAKVGDRLSRLGDRSLRDLFTSPPKGFWHEVRVGARCFEAIARQVETGSTPAGWVLVLRDVTRERELQEQARQQERLAAVGQLAAGVAHDFNNILGVITLYAGLSRREPGLSATMVKRLATIDDQAERASQLIQQILDFGRRSVLERLPVDLLIILKESVKLLRRTLPESIQVNMRYDEGSHVVFADPTRLQQVLLNLATNARDAMPDGGNLLFDLDVVSASSSFAPTARAGGNDWIRLRVSDSGEGISAGTMPHIFEPFFTTKERGRGTGLGLAQVYGIVKQHEGEVSAESQPGKGTTFAILLPALPTASVCDSEANTSPDPQGNGETILLVEDDAAMREAVADSLELLNYRVITAVDGSDALRVYRANGAEIALVVSDLVMPVMGGKGLFRNLKALNPSVKVVMLTGHPLEDELSRLQAEGLAGWLLKPPSSRQLAEIVASVLAA